YMRGTEPFNHAMQRLHDLCAARSIPVVLLVLGTEGSRRPYVIGMATELGFHVVEASSAFANHLTARGLEVNDATWRRVYDGVDHHPTADGHTAYADALFGEL